MATITFTVPDSRVAELRDNFAIFFNYDELIDGEPNPETKTEFFRRMTMNWWKDINARQNRLTQQAAITDPADINIT